MGRGQAATVGQERTAKNGYHYTKTDDGWRLTHHITAETKLGRPLRDDEIVKFVEPKFKRDPKNPAGVMVIKKKTSTLRRRKAVIETKMQELQNELKMINDQLAKM